jgi:uncharacterized membrane protein
MTSEVIAAMTETAEHDAVINHKETAMRTVLYLILATFGAYSVYVTWQIGYFGIWQAGMANVGTWQVLLDLSIMCFITLGFITRDARRTGRTVWPFAVITIAAGSFGPLLYLLLKPSAKGELEAPAAASVPAGR